MLGGLGVDRIDFDHDAALHEQRSHVDRLIQITAGVVAQIEHERLGPLRRELFDRLAHERIGVLRELAQLDVADVVLQLGGHIRLGVIGAHERRGEFVAARSIERRGSTPRDDDGRASLALHGIDDFGRRPFLRPIAIDGDHEIAGQNARVARRGALEHVKRIGLAVVFREEHAHARIVLRRRHVDIRRVAIGGIVAREGVVRGLEERIKHRRRAGIGIVGIEARFRQNAFDLVQTRGNLARIGRSRLDGGFRFWLFNSQTTHKVVVSAHDETGAKKRNRAHA